MRRTVQILGLAMATMILVGCLPSDGKIPNQRTDRLEDSEFSLAVKQANGFLPVEENGNLILSVNGKTAEISVRDLSSGSIWYSNPRNLLEAGASLDPGLGRALSQIEITYADAGNHVNEMNSYDDSVSLDQYVFEKIEGGIRVLYDIGKQEKIFLVPRVISEERFRTVILSKLDESEQESILRYYQFFSKGAIANKELESELIRKYPLLETENIYVLIDNLAEFVMERLQKITEKAGYRLEDLQEDDRMNGVGQAEQAVSFRIPVNYCIRNDRLETWITTKEIRYPEGIKLREIRLLSHFGAASPDDEGYLFIPDGSGALIHFNNGRARMGPCRIPLYGQDPALQIRERLTPWLKAHLPVYGMKKGDAAFLAILESGDALATINASISEISSSYNTIYPSFSMDQSLVMKVPYRDESDMDIYQRSRFDGELRVLFSFLGGKQATYIGMATAYREYLLDTGELAVHDPEDMSLYIDFLGAIRKEDEILGFPYTRTTSLTTFEQARSIAEQLQAGGVPDLTARYIGWANGGIEHSLMDSIGIQRQLGSKEDLADLMACFRDFGYTLFMDIDIQRVHFRSLFSRYSPLFDSPRDILGKPVREQILDTATGETVEHVSLLSPSRFPGVAESAVGSLKREGINRISLSTLGELLYSDFNSGRYIDRQQSIRLARQGIEAFRAAGMEFVIEGAHAYALKGAAAVIGLPATSNGFYLADEDVPFYQILLHGILPYASQPLNLAGDLERETLRLIETGTAPRFTWMAHMNEELKELKVDRYAVSYREWIDSAIRIHRDVANALLSVQGSRIIGHERVSETLARTEYSNGVCIYVNYDSKSVEADGHAIESMGYLVVTQPAGD